MIRLTSSFLLVGVVAIACSKAPAAEPKVAEAAETRYLTFQLMTGLPGYSGPPPMPGRFALSKSQLEAFVREWSRRSGPRETRGTNWASPWAALLRHARSGDSPVHPGFLRGRAGKRRGRGLSIDDSMGWDGARTCCPTPTTSRPPTGTTASTGRRGLGAGADQIPAPDVFQQPRDRRGGEGPRGADPQGDRARAGGVENPGEGTPLRGRDRRMGDADRPRLRDRPPPRIRALAIADSAIAIRPRIRTSNGFRSSRSSWSSGPIRSSGRRPARADLLPHRVHRPGPSRSGRQGVLREEGPFRPAGDRLQPRVPSRVLHLSRGGDVQGDLRRPREARLARVDLRRGGQRVAHGHARRADDGDLPGADVQPRGGAGEHLLLGHRGEAMRDNFFRRATENPKALAAYAKFLRQSPSGRNRCDGFFERGVPGRVRSIQAELPGWIQSSGKKAEAMPLIQKLQA